MSEFFQIKMLDTIDELLAVQKLEREIWQMDPLPLHQTLTAVKNGGMVLGGFDGKKLVGFSYGFPGFMGGIVYFCSHMLGILPSYQGCRLGEMLKNAQREWAIRMGYRLITWTFDPLESINGYLNLGKLHGICQTYIENCYGDMSDTLNQGLPSDRLLVEWWIDSLHVKEHHEPSLPKEEDLQFIEWKMNDKGFPHLADHVSEAQNKWRDVSARKDPLYIPIPSRFQMIKQEDFPLAMDWRLKSRFIFKGLFEQGYALAGVVRPKEQPVQYYRAVKRDQLQIDFESNMAER